MKKNDKGMLFFADPKYVLRQLYSLEADILRNIHSLAEDLDFIYQAQQKLAEDAGLGE